MPARKSEKRKSVPTHIPADERPFVNPSNVSPHLFCPICQEVFCNPQRAPCGHSFCKTCIDPWLQSNPTCPIDRKAVKHNDMHHDFIVESIIGDYTVACPWRALGCDFIGPLHILPSHKKTCVMNPTDLPPALREYSTALLNQKRDQPLQTSRSGKPKPTQSPSTVSLNLPNPCVENGAASQSSSELNAEVSRATTADTRGGNQNNSVVSEDESELLPPVPPPSLLFRLYQSSDTDSRDLLCNFIGSSTDNVSRQPPVKARRGRTAACAGRP